MPTSSNSDATEALRQVWLHALQLAGTEPDRPIGPNGIVDQPLIRLFGEVTQLQEALALAVGEAAEAHSILQREYERQQFDTHDMEQPGIALARQVSDLRSQVVALAHWVKELGRRPR